MKIIKLIPLCFSFSLILVNGLRAQLTLTSNLSYSQDFDKVAFTTDMQTAGTGDPLLWKKTTSNPPGTTSTAWANNSTITGWMRQVKAGGFADRSDKDFIGEMKGGTARFGLAGDGGSYGIDYSGGDNSETALGSVMQGTDSEISFGVVFDVQAGLNVMGANVSYTGEQWFRTGATHTMHFQYKILDSFSNFKINDETGWSDVNALDFNSQVTGGTSKINGNLAANQVDLSESISLSANDSQYVAFRWKYDSSASGAQSGLFVDDFTVNFTTVPESSAYALLAGVLALGLQVIRRYKR